MYFYTLGPNPRKSKDTLVDVDEMPQIKKDRFSYKMLEEGNKKVYIPYILSVWIMFIPIYI